MAGAVPEVAILAFYLPRGCAKILAPLVFFLGGLSARSPDVVWEGAAALFILPTTYLAVVTVAYFAGLLLPLSPATTMSLADLARFAVLLFMLVFACLVIVAVPLVAFFFLLAAGKRGTGSGIGWNVLS